MIEPRRASRRGRRARRARAVRLLLLLAAAASLFLVGLGLGQALSEAPPPAGQLTFDRTLEPLPPGETVTVTVTVTAP